MSESLEPSTGAQPSTKSPANGSRRTLLFGGAAAGAVGVGAGWTAAVRDREVATDRVRAKASEVRLDAAAPSASCDPHGTYQAGIDRPTTPQAYLAAEIYDFTDRTSKRVLSLLASFGKYITGATTGTRLGVGGLPPGDLSITVGLGPDVMREFGPQAPGRERLPEFANERVRNLARGGDLFVQVCAGDPAVATLAAIGVREHLGDAVIPRWRQDGFRGPAELRPTRMRAARNLLGFSDGIAVPRTEEELAEHVWLGGDSPLAGGSIGVVRRIVLDLERFHRLSVTEQEQVIGRRRHSGEPLSGGGPDADPRLTVKTPDGEHLIPNGAHVRRAHALASGGATMLRRSYSMHSDAGSGLLFISFQRYLRTFSATQERLDEGDALMDYATVTASANFFMLPGFDERRSLGSQLAAL